MGDRTILGFLMLACVACGTSSAVSGPSAVPVIPPSISSVSPPAASAGSDDVTITITGSGFQSRSFAVWSTSAEETYLFTKYVSDTQLTAIIPAKLVKAVAPAQLTVVNGDLMGWSDGYRGYPKSNALSFAIVDSR